MALIATICGGSTSTLANAPKAAQTIFNILQVLGDEAEDAVAALPAPAKALPAPNNEVAPGPEANTGEPA